MRLVLLLLHLLKAFLAGIPFLSQRLRGLFFLLLDPARRFLLHFGNALVGIGLDRCLLLFRVIANLGDLRLLGIQFTLQHGHLRFEACIRLAFLTCALGKRNTGGHVPNRNPEGGADDCYGNCHKELLWKSDL